MEPNYSEIFNKNILKSVSKYCELNGIVDVNVFINELILLYEAMFTTTFSIIKTILFYIY